LGAPKVKHLQGKLWELRSRGRVQHRVLYVAIVERRLLILHAFTKKTPRTPPQEIQTALARWQDYQARGLA
jgi:phage-related protein